MSWSRLLSAAVYVTAALLIFAARGSGPAFVFLVTQAFVLPFIWFADFFGEWIGPFPMSGTGGGGAKSIDRESPAWLVALFGWLILLGVFVVNCFFV